MAAQCSAALPCLAPVLHWQQQRRQQRSSSRAHLRKKLRSQKRQQGQPMTALQLGQRARGRSLNRTMATGGTSERGGWGLVVGRNSREAV